MSEVYDFVASRLRLAPSPYLFAGSGLSRRYADTPDWRGLLRHFAAFTEHPLEEYLRRAGGSLPGAASMLSEEFTAVWHRDMRFSDSRAFDMHRVAEGVTPLKIEVARYFDRVLDDFAVPHKLEREFELLAAANVDAIITTNYDRLLSSAYPDFVVYTGQDDVLFADPQGIGEIYMIHGSATQPESLVLTLEDYADFQDRNSYLAAKLLTFFAERPVFFVGYSLADDNVRAVLASLVRALRRRNVNRLRERLYFVAWDPRSKGTVAPWKIEIEGNEIEAYELRVPSFEELFAALGENRRTFPARVLRHLKEQVYELVSARDPGERLVSVAEIDDADQDLDVVFGVGAHLAVHGLVGLSRWDLFDDVLEDPELAFSADAVLAAVFDSRFARTWYVPYWKYLRRSGCLDSEGVPTDLDRIPEKVKLYLVRDAEQLASAREEEGVSFSDLLVEVGEEGLFADPWRTLSETRDAAGLQAFLRGLKDRRLDGRLSTSYAKLVLILDWMKYGPWDLADECR